VTSAVRITEEITAALGLFFHGGSGPTHATLTGVFMSTGYGSADPYDGAMPNKQERVHAVLRHAAKRPHAQARELVDSLLARLRVNGTFDPEWPYHDSDNVRIAQRAFAREGWTLSDQGELRYGGTIDLDTGGRHALDEQLARLQRATDDPGLLLGTAKELLEAVAKFVLEEVGCPARAHADAPESLSRGRVRSDLVVRVGQTMDECKKTCDAIRAHVSPMEDRVRRFGPSSSIPRLV
jgi:hypothetical protein